MEALRGIDFKKYRPTALVIESDSPEHQRRADEMLIPAGYHKIVKLSCNIFYSIDKSMGGKINNKLFRDVKLIHTEHPLDSNGEEVVVVDIDTRRAFASKKRLVGLIWEFFRKFNIIPSKVK